MRLRGRIDANQKQIVQSLRECGVSVWVTSNLGDGAPDIVTSVNGKNFLFEIKDGNKVKSKRKLTPEEEKFKEKWQGQLDVITNYMEALEIMGLLTIKN